MDCEKLIELVRVRECLYNMTSKKYSDHQYKERIWNEISKEVQQPVQVCKKTWVSLRDAFRRAMKKYITTSGESSKNVKKWKYEEETSFLKTYMKERESISSVGPVNDTEQNTSGEEENNIETFTLTESSAHLQNVDGSQSISPTDRQDNSVTPSTSKQSTRTEDREETVCNAPPRKRSKWSKSSESASSTLMKYILQKREDKSTVVNEINGIDQFFSTMSTTVKTFTPYYQHLAKRRVFSIISDLEFQQLPQQNIPRVAQQQWPQAHLQETTPTPINYIQNQNSYNTAISVPESESQPSSVASYFGAISEDTL